MAISRKQCILKCGDDNKWKLEDLSTSTTLINNIAVLPKVMQDILPGDIIQFGFNVKFKYRFNIVQKNGVRKVCISEKTLGLGLLSNKNICKKSIVKEKKSSIIKINRRNIYYDNNLMICFYSKLQLTRIMRVFY